MKTMNRQHLTSTAETGGTSVPVDSEKVSAADTEPSASTLVGMALAELREFGRLKSLKASALSVEDLREVCETIRENLLAEIVTGNTFFKADELEVAFDLELQKYGLHTAYANVLDSEAPPLAIKNVHTGTNGDCREGVDKSAVGFSKMEIKRIPRSARETINHRFSQMTIQGRARRKAQEISESDAICISDIVRILLTYQDSLGQQFHDRLGLSDNTIWALLHEQDISVLGADELEALVLLTEEANGLAALKEKLNDDFLELQIQHLRHMVLYRRLIRMEHAPDAQAQLQKVMDALELSVHEYASAEHIGFAGMSNHEIAPDLFPYGEDNTYLLDLVAELKGGRTTIPAQPMGSGLEGDKDVYSQEFEHHTIVTATAHGIFDWQPKPLDPEDYPASMGMPGSDAKLAALERRVRKGQPLCHLKDRQSYDSLGEVHRNDIPAVGFSKHEEKDEEGGEVEDEEEGEEE